MSLRRTFRIPRPQGDRAPIFVTPAARTELTTDRLDPRLGHGEGGEGMNEVYLVLSDEERARGFVRPVRRSYVHETCGAVTTMGLALSETYARDPHFYGATFCVSCNTHFRVGAHGEFVWDGTDEKVGT